MIVLSIYLLGFIVSILFWMRCSLKVKRCYTIEDALWTVFVSLIWHIILLILLLDWLYPAKRWAIDNGADTLQKVWKYKIFCKKSADTKVDNSEV